jgi:hypothetical protein
MSQTRSHVFHYTHDCIPNLIAIEIKSPPPKKKKRKEKMFAGSHNGLTSRMVS